MNPGYTITFYSKPNCVQCTAVERSLNEKGIHYAKADAIANVDELKARGFQQAPVVFFYGFGEHIEFSGFDAFKIDEIYALITANEQEEAA